METQIVKINPAEYGLQEAQAQTIEEAFMPKIVERNALAEIYEGLITGEISPELCMEARELRLKLVKVRTGIAEIHKTQKAFYLAAGRYVDAWKNKETAPVEQMEEKLSDIEKYYENLERERKNKLRDERIAELAKYEMDGSLMLLGEMKDEVWSNFLAGAKIQYEQKKEAERKAEEERLRQIEMDKIEVARQIEIAPYGQFIKDALNLREMPEAEYHERLSQLKALKLEYDKEQERVRKENERLKKEREKLEAAQEAERRKLAAEKAEAERKAKEAQMELMEQAKKDRERMEAERKAKEEAAAEEKRKAMAPDKDKLLDLAERIKSVPLPTLGSKEANEILSGVTVLLEKVDGYIKERTKLL